jgi:predicted O-linked N-acetylglucosamine transferase (SPINDLY family)
MQDAATPEFVGTVRERIFAADYVGAIEACEEALAQDQTSRDALFHLGIVAMVMGDSPRAHNIFLAAHQHHPDCREIVLMLASLSGGLGNLADATYYAKLSLTLTEDAELVQMVPVQYRDPSTVLERVNIPRHYVEAETQFQLGEYEAAVKSGEMAMHANPRDPNAYGVLGRSLIRLGHLGRAEAALHAAIHLAPQVPELRADLGEALVAQGRHFEGVALIEAAADEMPDSDELAARLVEARRRAPAVSPAQLQQAAQAWDKRFAITQREPAESNDGPALSIGYLINQHAAEHLLPIIEPVLTAHNPSRVNVCVLQQYPHDETATVRLKGRASSWHETYNVDDETLAFMLRQLRLDALIDLCGYTPGNRRPLLANAPAGLRLGWLSGGAELAGDALDYTFGDPITAELLGTERQIIVPTGTVRYLCAPTPSSAADAPALANGAVTFGGLADPARAVVAAPLWSKVLRAVPGSVLLLGNTGGGDQWAAERLRDLFAHWGLSDRIRLQEPDRSRATSEAFLSNIDILLDTPDINGVVETCEALREGVPVITLQGGTSDSCMGAGILTTAGHPEWIARTSDDFVGNAVGLAQDAERIASLRSTLRSEIPAGELANGASLAAAFEVAMLGLTRK